MGKSMSENFIHPTAVIEEGATLGRDNFIGPYCYLYRGVKLGNNNKLEGYASVGAPGEHVSYFGSYGPVIIGDNCVIREFTTINAGTVGTTRMGNSCIMLRGSHLSHDSVLEDNVTLSCNVLIGGESLVMTGTNMGLGSICHQRSIIPPYTMVGMGAIVSRNSNRKMEPGMVYAGNPARIMKHNSVGLQRAQVTDKMLSKERERFQELMAARR